MSKLLKIAFFVLIFPFFIFSCTGPDGKFKFPGGDARKTPADPKERVKKNLEQGKGLHSTKPWGALAAILEHLILQVRTNCGGLHLM